MLCRWQLSIYQSECLLIVLNVQGFQEGICKDLGGKIQKFTHKTQNIFFNKNCPHCIERAKHYIKSRGVSSPEARI